MFNSWYEQVNTLACIILGVILFYIIVVATWVARLILLKYNSVHMHDQNFSKNPLNEFLLPDENHP